MEKKLKKLYLPEINTRQTGRQAGRQTDYCWKRSKV